VWSGIGLIASLLTAAFAWNRSRSGGGYYDTQVYEMTARTHRSVALAALAFAAIFAATFALHGESIAVATLGIFVTGAIFYGASFLRGASDDE